MEHDQAMQARHAGELIEATAVVAEGGNGWILAFATADGGRMNYTGHGGLPKVFHTLDHVTELARELGFESLRVEESF